MARETIYTDDIDGSRDAKPVVITFDNFVYEVDLGPKNLKVLQPFMDKANNSYPVPVKDSKASTSKSGRVKRDPQYLAAVRDWARKNGHEVSDRGQVKGSIIAAYEEAKK